jgi:hypothetical protein
MFKSHPDEECTRSFDDWGLAEVPVKEPEFTSIRQALHARELPEAEGLAETELIALLNDLEIDLLQSRIRVDFLDTLPARVAYKGILQLLDTPVPVGDDPREVRHLDGCDSACESCFQLAHCGVAREVLGPAEWRFAVEQAGINPSWSALFSEGGET